MVASQAAMEHGPEQVVQELTASMEAHAASGDWERVEEVAARLERVVMQVPEDRRRDVLLTASSAAEHVASIARTAHDDIGARLTAIRRGKDATRAYEGKD